MRSNTKLLRVINNIQTALIEKGKTFKHHFVPSTFFLFFGFICGNLFGTFLNYFRIFIHWDGAIIAITLLFIEIINYLNFVILKRYCEHLPLQLLPLLRLQKQGKQGLKKQGEQREKNTIDSSFNQKEQRLPMVSQSQKGNTQTFFQAPYTPGTVDNIESSPWSVVSKKEKVDRPGTIKLKFGLLIRFLNFFKIGLLLGFFIDAFKVGS